MLKNLILQSLEDAKAKEITYLDVRNLTDMTDGMIIAHGTSTRHVKSMARKVQISTLAENIKPVSCEGEPEGEWILLDYVDFIVHLMTLSTREYYDLERLWDQRLAPIQAVNQ